MGRVGGFLVAEGQSIYENILRIFWHLSNVLLEFLR